MLLNTNLVTLARRLSHSWSRLKGRKPLRRRTVRNAGVVEVLEERTLLAVFTVNTLLDAVDAADGKVSLREAVASANAAVGADEIQFDASLSGPIVLNGTQLLITDAITVTGNGPSTTIDGDAKSRVFSVTGGNATFTGLTIRNGRSTDAGAAGSGGGISFQTPTSANITIRDSTISGNNITGADAFGGGLFADGNGDITISGSTFSGNSTAATAFGGGIKLNSGSGEIVNSTISGNSGGGGLISFAAHMSLINITVTGNSTGNSDSSGGVGSFEGALGVYNSIVAGNTNSAGGAVDLLPSAIFNTFLDHSILGNNTGAGQFLPAPLGTPDSGGNFIGSGASPISSSVIIGPLADNGGPTLTHNLLANSPALNAGSNNHVSPPVHNFPFDQRGATRIVDTTVDMGAVEFQTLPNVSFGVAAQTKAEDVGAFTILVTLSAAQNSAVTVPFTVGGTAGNPGDLTIVASPLVFAAGQTTKTISVTVVNDTDVEPDETLTVTLGTPTGAPVLLGATTTQTVTITDNDMAAGPIVNFAQETRGVSEIEGTVQLVVNLSAPALTDVSVPFTVEPSSTATSGEDFTIATGALFIKQGATSAPIDLTIASSKFVHEEAETVVVKLGTPIGGNATLGTVTTQTILIIDEDPSPAVIVNPPTIIQNESGGSATFDVSIPAGSTFEDITVPYTLSGTATSPADFTVSPAQQVVIPKGQDRASIIVTIVDDQVVDPDETIIVTLGTPIGGNARLFADPSFIVATLTITDNDAAPTVSFGTTQVIETEGTIHIVQPFLTVNLSVPATADVSIPYTLSGTAGAADFSIAASPLIILAGQSSGQIPFTVADDDEIEADETIIVTLGTPTGGNAVLGTDHVATITIPDNDSNPPTFTSPDTASVPENTTAVRTVTATDPDGQTPVFSITGGADRGLFDITPAGVLTFKTAPDFDDQTVGSSVVKVVEVTADDERSGIAKQTITVTVTGVNENAPVFTSPSSFSVVENTTAVGSLVATDIDLPNVAPSFSITGGADAALFEIADKFTGTLKFKTAPDFETPADADQNNVYVVEVTADDNVGSTATPPTNQTTTQTINVTVTDVANEAPEIGLKASSANAFTSTSQGVLIGTDATFTALGTTNLAGAVLTISGAGVKDRLIFVNDRTLVSSRAAKVRAGGITSFRYTLSSTGGGVLGVVSTGDRKGNPGKQGVPLVLTLSNNATAADVQNVLRHLAFTTTDKTSGIRTLTIKLEDVLVTSNTATRQINVNPTVPNVTLTAGDPTINLSSDPQVLAFKTTALIPGATFAAVGTPNLNGAKLTLAVQGPSANLVEMLFKPTRDSGLKLFRNGVKGDSGIIGTMNNNRGNPLEITFNGSATAADIQNLLRSLAIISKVKTRETHTLTVQLTNVGGTPANPGVNSNLAQLNVILATSFDPGR